MAELAELKWQVNGKNNNNNKKNISSKEELAVILTQVYANENVYYLTV